LTDIGRGATAVAIALLTAALAAAGCGLGPGKGLGEASLSVTRDFGARPLVGPLSDRVTEADTVMRVLERNADIETRYSGGFVQSIEGLEADEGGGAGPEDWFFYVNGVESPVGAAQVPLHGGEAIWWDYHPWQATLHVPAVVGSWPQPFAGGYEGESHPVEVDCLGGGAGSCGIVRGRLRAAGVTLGGASADGAMRVLVGPWARLRGDAAAGQIDRGAGTSGVYAELEGEGGCGVEALDEIGHPVRRLGPNAGLVAATRRFEAPPTWVVTGCDAQGVRAASELLDAADLRDRFAVAVESRGGPSIPLPVPDGG
jgi:uncharacterized protein DUF4430